jgi:protein-disulfide isomerase
VYAQRGGAAFWRFHDAVLRATQSGALDAGVIEALALDQSVDGTRLRRALASGIHEGRIDADIRAGEMAGVNGTPAFLVNDWLAVGLLPYGEFSAVVRHALTQR